MRRTCLSLATVVLAGCGYVGAPMPPTLDIPGKVTDLRVLQHADKVLIDFTIPPLTTEELPLKLGKVELLAGAIPLDAPGAKPGPVHLEYPAAQWLGREVSFRVRVVSQKGRDSGWTEAAAFPVIAPLETPSGLKAEAVPQGVRLVWSGPQSPAQVMFRIRRRTGKDAAAEVAMVGGREWLDTDTSYVVSYEYTLQAVVKPGAESAISEPFGITPVDRFPPATPQGLTVLAATSSIELTWDRNTEPDLRGYYLYRGAGDKPVERIGGVLDTPAYSDREVLPGIRYRYDVSSADGAGNESQTSQPVEATLP